ncbi:MAG: RcpC/CpaB family pilus assembly protein [Eubacteriales bacterium]|nr:RcpC/CpaB family pilus assembly protein [Eubacteriales bacterium]
MRKSRQNILAVLLSIILLGAAFWAGQGDPPPPMMTIVVLKETIPAGSQLTLEQLEVIDLPAHDALSNYLQNANQAVGLWTKTALLPGSFLLPEQLATSASGMTYPQAGPGRRLMTIELRSGDANGIYLASGNRIDLYMVPKSTKDTVTETIENVRVAAVLAPDGRMLDAPIEQGQATVLLCLDVDTDQARRLAEAQSRAFVRVSVHNESN